MQVVAATASYLDDVLIAGKDYKECCTIVEQVLQKLSTRGIRVNRLRAEEQWTPSSSGKSWGYATSAETNERNSSGWILWPGKRLWKMFTWFNHSSVAFTYLVARHVNVATASSASNSWWPTNAFWRCMLSGKTFNWFVTLRLMTLVQCCLILQMVWQKLRVLLEVHDNSPV